MDASVWLRYNEVDHEYVATLKCCVCTEFNEMLRGMHNYNPAFCGWFQESESVQLQRAHCYQHAQTSNASFQEAELH